MRLLATMGSGNQSQITIATTKVTGGEVVDDSANLLTVSRTNTHTLGAMTGTIGIGNNDGTGEAASLAAGSNPAAASNAAAIEISQKVSLATLATSVLTISLPLTITGPGADF